jgi:hypothetical protein
VLKKSFNVDTSKITIPVPDAKAISLFLNTIS